MNHISQVPKYINPDTFEHNQYKITFNLPLDDKYLIANIYHGSIITSDVYPLIYDGEYEKPHAYYRSIPFYTQVIQNSTLYDQLTEDNKIYFAIGLRDLYIAYMKNFLDKKTIKLLKSVIKITKDDVIGLHINNMKITPYPCNNNLMMQYLDIEIDDVHKQYFIKNNLGLYMVFINPIDLSYHNFENIIDLNDYTLKYTTINKKITNYLKYPSHDVISFEIENNLLQIDQLDLYSIPLNKNTRGGKRLIFKSNSLSNKLTNIIKTNIIKKCKIFSNFKRVNSVFRYNKFHPGDKKFISHYDTPYYDAQSKLCSKYTLIIYLTEGTADPVLKIDQLHINNIRKNTCLIFNQSYEHEGYPFIENDKIFIRSELIFYDSDLKHDSDAAKIFNIGSYMTKESLFNKELKDYSNKCFNHAVKLRYKLAKITDIKLVLLHKVYNNINYVTNGHDFFFGVEIDPKIASFIIFLDYFNGKILDSSYHSKIIKVIDDIDTNDESFANDIYLFLNKYAIPFDNDFKCCDIQEIFRGKLEYPDNNNEHCCPFHCNYNFNPEKCNGIIEAYNNYYKKINIDFSAIIMNQRLYINFADIVIEKNKIYFKNTGFSSRINFASCWTDGFSEKDWIKIEKKSIEYFNLPYITYNKTNIGYHFSIDMFGNDFIFSKTEIIEYPTIRDNYTGLSFFDDTDDDHSKEDSYSQDDDE